MPLIELPQSFILGCALLLGLVVGSFLNVLILRLPRKMYAEHKASCTEDESEETPANRWFGLDYLITPSSHCPKCNHLIRAWQNIPIISWLLLRGKCSNCSTEISIRYPVIEAVTGLLTLAVVWHFGATSQTLYISVLFWGLISLTVIDIDEQLLPDELTLPLLWLGLIFNFSNGFVSLEDAVIGAIAGYLSLWFVFQVFRLITGKEGMGYGDFKLFALFGAWLGWQLLPQILLLSSLLGAIIGISLVLIQGRDKHQPLPFGPYLTLAGTIAFFWGEQINQAYWQFSGL